MNNQAFESLNIIFLNSYTVNSGHLYTLEYTLEQFNGLKELSLVCKMTLCKGGDKVIGALSGHVFYLIRVQISMEGCIKIAASLHNPIFNLTALAFIKKPNQPWDCEYSIIGCLNGNRILRELDLGYLIAEQNIFLLLWMAGRVQIAGSKTLF